ncbi:hypothetical protein D3C80_1082800 [compost metagenome]
MQERIGEADPEFCWPSRLELGREVQSVSAATSETQRCRWMVEMVAPRHGEGDGHVVDVDFHLNG